jgi:hypothetical protein
MYQRQHLFVNFTTVIFQSCSLDMMTARLTISIRQKNKILKKKADFVKIFVSFMTRQT